MSPVTRYEARCNRSEAACMTECPWPRCLRVHEAGVHPEPQLAKVIQGPWRAPESRVRIAVEVVLAFLALAVAGAFFGAALGWIS